MQEVVKLIDSYTGEVTSYYPIIEFEGGGVAVTDADVDGVIIRKKGDTYYKRAFTGPVNVKWWGMLPDYDPATEDSGTDYTDLLSTIFSLYKNVYIPTGNYRISKYPRTNGLTVTGELDTSIYLFYNDTPTMVQFGNDNYCQNVMFYSTEADLNNSRASVEQSTNVTLRNCGFFNFRNPTNINSWGLYFKNAKDCLVDNCYFGNNSQSDLAIVDNNTNITILNPVNNIDTNGMFIDIEPNSTLINKGIIINGGVFRQLNLLNNNNTVDASTDISVVGAQINTLKYNGANATFIECTIQNITNSINSVVFAGKLNIKAHLSENLVKDPYFYDLDQTDAARLSKIWQASSSWKVNRVGNSYLDINYDNTAQSIGVTQGENITVDAQVPYLIFFKGGANYPTGTTNAGNLARVDYYDSSTTLLSSSSIRLFRGAAGSIVATKSQFGLIIPPENTVSIRIIVGNFTTTATTSIQIQYIGLFKVLSLTTGNLIMDYVEGLIKNNNIYPVAKLPVLSTASGSNIGDIVKLYTPALTSSNLYICTESGKPGVFKPIDVISATTSINGTVKQATAQADSTATDLETLTADYNSLLAKLRTAGILAT